MKVHWLVFQKIRRDSRGNYIKMQLIKILCWFLKWWILVQKLIFKTEYNYCFGFVKKHSYFILLQFDFVNWLHEDKKIDCVMQKTLKICFRWNQTHCIFPIWRSLGKRLIFVFWIKTRENISGWFYFVKIYNYY